VGGASKMPLLIIMLVYVESYAKAVTAQEAKGSHSVGIVKIEVEVYSTINRLN
jgi:hypothetical protein